MLHAHNSTCVILYHRFIDGIIKMFLAPVVSVFHIEFGVGVHKCAQVWYDSNPPPPSCAIGDIISFKCGMSLHTVIYRDIKWLPENAYRRNIYLMARKYCISLLELGALCYAMQGSNSKVHTTRSSSNHVTSLFRIRKWA